MLNLNICTYSLAWKWKQWISAKAPWALVFGWLMAFCYLQDMTPSSSSLHMSLFRCWLLTENARRDRPMNENEWTHFANSLDDTQLGCWVAGLLGTPMGVAAHFVKWWIKALDSLICWNSVIGNSIPRKGWLFRNRICIKIICMSVPRAASQPIIIPINRMCTKNLYVYQWVEDFIRFRRQFADRHANFSL